MLSAERYIEAIRADGAALANAAEADMTARVPSCPEWTQADLVAHVGGIYTWVERIVTGRLTEGAGRYSSLRADGDALLGEYRHALERLVESFTKVDGDEVVWNWVGERRAASWFRRMAAETAVHRWDAQLARGHAEPIDADVAADAVAELLEVFAPAAFAAWKPRLAARGGRGFDGRRVRVDATDGGSSWIVKIGPDEFEVSAGGDASADLTLAGPASELLLVLRQRRPKSGVEVSGDGSLLTALRRLYP